MEEAQELSNRVGIFDHGELITCGTQNELMQKVGEKDTILITVGENADSALPIVQKVTGIDSATATDGTLKLLAGRGRQALPAVIKALDEAHFTLQSIEVKEPNLEAVFLEMTGRALRDYQPNWLTATSQFGRLHTMDIQKVLTIALKDVRITFGDRNLLIIMIAAPLLLTFIIGAAFSRFTGSNGDVPIESIAVGVVNEDQGTTVFLRPLNYGAILSGILIS